MPFVHPSQFVHLLTKVSVENLAKLVAFKVLQKWCSMLLHLHEYSTYYLIIILELQIFLSISHSHRNHFPSHCPHHCHHSLDHLHSAQDLILMRACSSSCCSCSSRLSSSVVSVWVDALVVSISVGSFSEVPRASLAADFPLLNL